MTRGSAEDGNNAVSSKVGKGAKRKRKRPNRPKYRGSRAFEILGIDIMLDSQLKPWLIEVNHLPSFGTDSPLDEDIKSRLIQDVFKILPAKHDDEIAYVNYHKTESVKRLTGKSSKGNKQDMIRQQQSGAVKGPVRGSKSTEPEVEVPPENDGARMTIAEQRAAEEAEREAARLAAEREAAEKAAAAEREAVAAAEAEARKLAAQIETPPDELVTPERLAVIIETLEDARTHARRTPHARTPHARTPRTHHSLPNPNKLRSLRSRYLHRPNLMQPRGYHWG